MPTTSTLANGPVATLVAELADLLKLAKIAARMQLEKAAPEGWTTPDEVGVIWPRFKDEKEFRRAAKSIGELPGRLGAEVDALVSLVAAMTSDLDAFTIRAGASEEELRARAAELDAPWRCRQFTVRRRAIEVRLRILHALIAELYCSLEQIYSNVELIYLCPPHPCDDPAIPPDDLRLAGAWTARPHQYETAAAEAAETAEGDEESEARRQRRPSRRGRTSE